MGVGSSHTEGTLSSFRSGCVLLPRLAALCLLALVLALKGCGGDGDGSGSGTTVVPGPGVSITLPTSDPTFSQICNSELLAGSAGFGEDVKCCNGTAEELTGVRVTWTNATTGASGQAVQFVQVCPIVILCNHTWSATVPLVLGDNQITITATDTRTGGTSTDTITIDKPILTYTVSGTFLSHLNAPPGNALSSLQVTRVGADGSHSANILPTGSYGLSCVPDGSYTLTPSSTILYMFAPANLSVIVNGADVPMQNFTAQAFTISGSVTFTSNNAGVENQRIDLSGSGSTATAFTASSGFYSFLVPNGTYTLTPLNSLGFPEQTTPPNSMVTVNNADVPGQNFTR